MNNKLNCYVGIIEQMQIYFVVLVIIKLNTKQSDRCSYHRSLINIYQNQGCWYFYLFIHTCICNEVLCIKYQTSCRSDVLLYSTYQFLIDNYCYHCLFWYHNHNYIIKTKLFSLFFPVIPAQGTNKEKTHAVSPTEDEGPDVVADVIGKFGRWQLLMTFLLSLFSLPCTFHIYLPTFTVSKMFFFILIIIMLSSSHMEKK